MMFPLDHYVTKSRAIMFAVSISLQVRFRDVRDCRCDELLAGVCL